MNKQPLRQRVARNSLIVAAGDWALRLISVVSMVILARILSPSDFGLAAAAAAIVVFLKALTSVGQVQYLVQKTELEQADLDTAWSARLLYSLIATGLILGFTHKISGFFNEPRLVPILYILAWIPVLDALRSLGPALLQRELDFSVNTRISLVSKLVSFITTVSAAIYLQNYWALIIGEIASALSVLVTSHLYAPQKVSLSLSRYGLQWHFVKWMYIQGVFNLIREKVDTLLVTRYLGVATGGHYAMSIRLGDLAVNNFMRPLGATLYAGFAKVKSDPRALRASSLEAATIMLFIITPIFVWVSMAAHPLVLLVLGEKWTDIVPIIPIVTAMFCMMQFIGLLNTVLIITGKFKASTAASAVSIILFVATILAMAPDIHLERFAAARALTIGLSALLMTLTVMGHLGIGLPLLIRNLWKPVVAGLLSALAVLGMLVAMPALKNHVLLELLATGVVVLITYLAPFYLWRAFTGKSGQELDFIHKLLIPIAKSFYPKRKAP